MPPRPGGVEMAAIVSTIAAVISGTFDSVDIAQFIVGNRCAGGSHLDRLLNSVNVAQAYQQGQDSDDAEAAVDEAPVKRDPPDGSCDQGQRQHSEACNNSKNEHPLIAYW